MTTETFDVPTGIAETYEARFVPAIFDDWARSLLQRVPLSPGQRVLDVGCGTGIVARHAAAAVGPTGEVVGVDPNAAMLAVARRVAPELTFQAGTAEALPFPDDRFDVSLSQAAAMFFVDPTQALREMKRVTRPGGTVAMLVPGRLEASPGYVAFVDVAARHAGPQAIELLGTYFRVGDPDVLRGFAEGAGLDDIAVQGWLGATRLGSIEEFVVVETESTPLIERLDDEAYARIKADSEQALAGFLTDDGVAVPIEVQLVTGVVR